MSCKDVDGTPNIERPEIAAYSERSDVKRCNRATTIMSSFQKSRHHRTGNAITVCLASMPSYKHRHYYSNVTAAWHVAVSRHLWPRHTEEQLQQTATRSHEGAYVGWSAAGAPLSQRFWRNEVKVVVVRGHIKVVAIFDQLLSDLAGSRLGRG